MKRFFVMLCLLIAACLIFSSALAGGWSHESHYFGVWTPGSLERQRAECVFCGYKMRVDCSELSFSYGGNAYTVCPVCGRTDTSNGYFQQSTTLLYDFDVTPLGDTCVYKYDKLIDDQDVICVFSFVFEYAGEIESFDGKLIPTVRTVLPEEFELIYVNGAEETPIDYTYDSANNLLSFNLDTDNAVLIVKAK